MEMELYYRNPGYGNVGYDSMCSGKSSVMSEVVKSKVCRYSLPDL